MAREAEEPASFRVLREHVAMTNNERLAGVDVSIVVNGSGQNETRLSEVLRGIDEQTARIAELEADIRERQEREAACCPEDVGFDEYIASLAVRIAALEAQVRAQGEDAARLERLTTLARLEEITVAANEQRVDIIYDMWRRDSDKPCRTATGATLAEAIDNIVIHATQGGER